MNTTQPIRDEELIAYYWRDDLTPARRAEIESELARSAALRARYAALARELEAMAGALPTSAQPAPTPDFEARLWQRIEARLPSAQVTTLRPRAGARSAPWRWAMAATVLLAVGAGYWLGRHDAPQSSTMAQLSDDAAARLLAAYLSGHLDNAERAFLIAANSPEQEDTARRLAEDLLHANRLYAQAAERAGKPQLAAFLREIDPVLRELALPGAAGAQAARARIEQDDLTFKTRAAARLTRRVLASHTTQT